MATSSSKVYQQISENIRKRAQGEEPYKPYKVQTSYGSRTVGEQEYLKKVQQRAQELEQEKLKKRQEEMKARGYTTPAQQMVYNRIQDAADYAAAVRRAGLNVGLQDSAAKLQTGSNKGINIAGVKLRTGLNNAAITSLDEQIKNENDIIKNQGRKDNDPAVINAKKTLAGLEARKTNAENQLATLPKSGEAQRPTAIVEAARSLTGNQKDRERMIRDMYGNLQKGNSQIEDIPLVYNDRAKQMIHLRDANQVVDEDTYVQWLMQAANAGMMKPEEEANARRYAFYYGMPDAANSREYSDYLRKGIESGMFDNDGDLSMMSTGKLQSELADFKRRKAQAEHNSKNSDEINDELYNTTLNKDVFEDLQTQGLYDADTGERYFKKPGSYDEIRNRAIGEFWRNPDNQNDEEVSHHFDALLYDTVHGKGEYDRILYNGTDEEYDRMDAEIQDLWQRLESRTIGQLGDQYNDRISELQGAAYGGESNLDREIRKRQEELTRRQTIGQYAGMEGAAYDPSLIDPETEAGYRSELIRLQDEGGAPAENKTEWLYWIINNISDKEQDYGGGFLGELTGVQQAEQGYRKYSFMTDEMIGQFNALYEAGKVKEAQAFMDAIDPYITQLASGRAEELRYNASKGNFGGLYGAMTILRQPIAGLSGTMGALAAIMGNEDAKNPNSGWYKWQKMNNTTRGARAEAWGDFFADKFGEQYRGAGEWLNGVTYSIADNLMAMAIARAGGSVFNYDMSSKAAERMIQFVMSSSAASSSMVDKISSGMDPTEAALYAVGNGIIEAITEKYSIEALLQPDIKEMLGDWKKVGKFLLKNTIAEGTEEGASDVLNTIWDEMLSGIYGHESELTAQYNALIAQGMKPEDATRQVLRGWLANTGSDMLAGALSGFVMSGGRTAMNTVQQQRAGAKIRNKSNTTAGKTGVEQLIEAARGMDADTESRRMAEELNEKVQSGKKVSSGEAGRLAQNILYETNETMGNIARDTVERMVRDTMKENGATPEQIERTAGIVTDAVVKNRKLTKGEMATVAEVKQAIEAYRHLMTNEGKMVTGMAVRLNPEGNVTRSVRETVGKLLNGKNAEKVEHRISRDIMQGVQNMVLANEEDLANVQKGKRSNTGTDAIVDNEIVQVTGKEGDSYIVKTEDGMEKKVNSASVLAVDSTIGALMEYAEGNGKGVLSDAAFGIIVKGAEQNNKMATAKYITEAMRVYLAVRTLGEMPETTLNKDTAETIRQAALQEIKEANEKRLAAGQMKVVPGKGTAEFNGAQYGTDEWRKNARGLSKEQRNEMGAVAEYARYTGLHVKFINDPSIEEVYGWEDRTTGRVTINLAGKHEDIVENGKVSYGGNHHMLVTAAHEFTHWLEQNSPEQYAELRKFIFDKLRSKGQDIESLIQEKIDIYRSAAKQNENVQELDIEGAMAEIVADACDQVLGNEKVAREIQQSNQNLYNKIKGFVTNLVARIRAAVAGMENSASEESKLMMSFADELTDKWLRALKEAQGRQEGKTGTESTTKDENRSYLLRDKNKKIIEITEKELEDNRKEVANSTPVTTIKTEDYQRFTSGSIVEEGSKYFDEIGRYAENEILGQVELATSGLRHLAGRNDVSRLKSIIIPAIKPTIEKGKLVNIDNNNEKSVDTAVLASRVTMPDGDYYVAVVVSQDNGGTRGQKNRYSFHNAIAIKEGYPEGSMAYTESAGSVTLMGHTPIISILRDIMNYNAKYGNEGISEQKELKEVNPHGMEIDPEYSAHPESEQFSVRQVARAAKLEMIEDDDTLTLYMESANGKKVKGLNQDKRYVVVDGDKVKITPEMMKSTPVGMLIDMGLSSKKQKMPDGTVTSQKDAALKMFADLMNLCAKYKDHHLIWEIAGSEFAETFSALKSNADPQYRTTVDFGTICAKTQAIVDVLSETMINRVKTARANGDVFKGLTRDDVMMVYDKTHNAKLSVPCQVCYVFSRWMGVPSLLGQMNRFQHDYVVTRKIDGKTVYDENGDAVIDWEETQKVAEEYIRRMMDKYGSKENLTKVKQKINDKIRRRENSLPKLNERLAAQKKKLETENLTPAKERNLRESIKKTELAIQRNIKDTDQFTKDGEEVEGFNWVTQALGTIDENGKYTVDKNFRITPEEILFDLNRTGEFAGYKNNWSYRTTRGAGMGKAIMPYSGADIGDLVNANSRRWTQEQNPFLTMNRKEAERALENAKKRVRQQNLVGGQRFQSTSDFRPEWGLDYLMSFLEMQALGSKVQMYTKVAEAVDFLGSIGADLNQSIMGSGNGWHIATEAEIRKAKTDLELRSRMGETYDENGTKHTYVLDFSDVTGMDYNTAKANTKKYNSVQMILVGMNDIHIRLAIGNDDIDFVIPWHSSGNSRDVLQQLVASVKETLTESSDYTDFQTDHIKSHEVREGRKKTTIDDRTDAEKNLWNARVKLLSEGANELTDEERKTLEGNKYTRDLLRRFTTGEEAGIILPKDQAEQIFPYEYWDKSSTRENADVNGRRFVEYCDALGLVPRFSQFKNDHGYWKLLIDRKMYDNNVLNEDGTVKKYGKYREQQVVDVTKATIGQLPESTTAKYRNTRSGAYTEETQNAIMASTAALSEKYDAKLGYNPYDGEKAETVIPKTAQLSIRQKQNQDYMEAVNSGDMAKARELLVNYAESKGLVRAYHGTNDFGFTKFDMERSQNQIFVGYDRGVSETYVEGDGYYAAVRDISTRDFDPGKATKEELAQFIKRYGLQGYNREEIKEVNYLTNSEYIKKMQEAGERPRVSDFDGVFEIVYTDDYAEALPFGDPEAYVSFTMAKEEIKENMTGEGGMYQLFVRPGKELVIDADDADWNAIPFEGKEYKTRELAEIARERGYDSLRINNVYDDGGSGQGSGYGDIGIFFNPNDVKSADTVTYDDNGDVIPLSERFSDESNDLRYSIRQNNMEINRWMQGLTDGSVSTAQEKAMLKQYQTLAKDLDVARGLMYKRRQQLEEMLKKPNLSVYDKKKIRDLETTIEAKKREMDQKEKKLLQMTSEEGFASLMYEQSRIMNELVNGRTVGEVQQTVDDLSGELDMISKQMSDREKEIADLKKKAQMAVLALEKVPGTEAVANQLRNIINQMDINQTNLQRYLTRINEVAENAKVAGVRTGNIQKAVDAAIAYNNKLTEQSEAATWQEERRRLVNTLRSEHTQAMLRQQAEFRMRIERDKNIQKAIRENQAMARKIDLNVNRVRQMLTHENNQRFVPEHMKPIAREMLRKIVNNEATGRWSLTGFDSKQLAEMVRVLDAWDKQDGKYTQDSLRGMDEGLADALVNALEDLQRGIDFLNAGERNTDRMVNIQAQKNALTRVYEAVTTITGAIYAERSIALGDRRVAIEDQAYKVQESAGDKRAKELTGSLGRTIAALRKAVTSGNLTPEYFFKMLKNAGLNDLWEEYHRAENRNGLELAKSKAKLDEIAQKYGYKSWDTDARQEVKLASGSVNMTLGQIMSLYATWKREHTLGPAMSQHLLNGGFYVEEYDPRKGILGRRVVDLKAHRVTEADMEMVNSLLTDEQKKFVDDIVGYMSTDMSELGNEASLKAYGIKMYKESYYFPFKMWDGIKARASNDSGSAAAANDRAFHPSFSKTRLHGANNALMLGDFMTTAADHIVGMINYATMGLANENLQKVLNAQVPEGERMDQMTRRTIRTVLEEAYGRAATEYLAKLQEQLNGGAVRVDRTIYDRMLTLFRKNAVAGSMSVALQQPLSYIRAAMMINPKYMTEALAREYWKGSYQERLKHSGVSVIKDMGRFDMGFGQGAREYITPEGKEGKVRQVWDAITDKATILPELMDRWTWNRLWVAVKAEQHAQHPDMDVHSDEFLDMVGERFNDIVRKTQVYDSTLTKSQNMRSQNPFVKSITSFMAEPTLSLNALADAVQNAKEKGGKVKLAKALATFALSAMAQAAAKALMSTGRTPDDKKTWMENYLYRYYANLINEGDPLNLIPGYNDMITLLKNGKLEDDAMGVLGKLFTAGDKLAGAFKEGAGYRDIEDSFGQIVQLFTQLPAKNIMRDLRAMYNWFIGKPYADRPNSAAVIRQQTVASLMTADNLVGVISAKLGEAGYKVNNTAYYDRMYNAIQSGNKQEADAIREYLTLGKGVKEETIDSNMRTMTRKDNLFPALEANKAAEIAKAIKELQEYGSEVKDIKSAITKEMKPKYLAADAAGKVKIRDAIQKAYRAMGLTAEDANKVINGWKDE